VPVDLQDVRPGDVRDHVVRQAGAEDASILQGVDSQKVAMVRWSRYHKPPAHSIPVTVEATLEIRTASKTGPLVPSLADVTARSGQQADAMKQQWRDRLAKDPASFAPIEVEIHDHFRGRADQMTASLLAEATTSGDRAEPEGKGGAEPTDRNAPRKRGG
jgi:hypothetical protein